MENKITVNKVLKVIYAAPVGVKRKIFRFIGLCVKYSKRNQTIYLRNIFNSIPITLIFFLNSPFIFSIEILKNYNFNYKKAVLAFKKNILLKEPPYANIVIYKPIFKKKFIPTDFLLDYMNSTLGVKKLKKKFKI